ncbi:hypothetical protein Trco_005694 [Trichoderma cornu-damae]|uniref:Uncharacterized protein n=1 Tax=Trichoderma cornu-damae TaxID=654480 RepID=A0A9P8QJX1_9HYPO|nr:hypothetical protein Trco_005694 [Trichoderma cornu-damae]
MAVDSNACFVRAVGSKVERGAEFGRFEALVGKAICGVPNTGALNRENQRETGLQSSDLPGVCPPVFFPSPTPGTWHAQTKNQTKEPETRSLPSERTPKCYEQLVVLPWQFQHRHQRQHQHQHQNQNQHQHQHQQHQRQQQVAVVPTLLVPVPSSAVLLQRRPTPAQQLMLMLQPLPALERQGHRCA